MIPVATAAFNELIAPCMGIVTEKSHRFIILSDIPLPSLPTTSAIDPL